MMNKRIFFSILLLFLVLFVLFMFSVLSVNMFSKSDDNLRGSSTVSSLNAQSALTPARLAMPATEENAAADTGATADIRSNPVAVLITASPDDEKVFTDWCTYSKYRYQHYSTWPQSEALTGADVILVGQMDYTAGTAETLRQYTLTGIPILFTRLPDYTALAASDDLMDIFGIEQCISPAYTVDGMKLFADFFLSKERIYTSGDFYGEADDTSLTLPYYTLRAGYDGYLVGLLNDQLARGIENEQLPLLLWRTYTGQSQVFAVNTDLFDGQRMLGVLTAFITKAKPWHLYPVVNARTILMTDYPFLSYENSDTAQKLYSRDIPGFQRDIIWPNVMKIFRNYNAPANFFVTPQFNYTDREAASADDLALYWNLIKGQSGTIALSLDQTSSLPLQDVAAQADSFFSEHLDAFRFYAAYAGQFSREQWQAWLAEGSADILSDLSLVVFPYSREHTLLEYINDHILSVQMTADGFSHETLDDLQLLSLMTALGYSAQQVDMSRALLPQSDADGWTNLSELWSKGDTFYKDFAAFETTSVYELEIRARRLLSTNFSCERRGDTLLVTVSPLEEEQWFVLRLHRESVAGISGGEAVPLSDTAWLIGITEKDARIMLEDTHYLQSPPGREGQ